MQTTLYRSTDGGKTFISFKGAPGGDDYHNMWIDPQNSARIILGVDQGSIISVDGGKTWTTWFNQATGQFYHVSTDNEFPYIAYAAQQDSGTAEVPSRSDYGSITYRDWFSTAGFEYSYIAPDPLNPDVVYSGGWYGSVVRFDRTTGQFTHVFVRGSKYRTTNMPPLVFSPQDPRLLYLGAQVVLHNGNGGENWQAISPDLTARAGAKEKTTEKTTKEIERRQSPPNSLEARNEEPQRASEVSPGHSPEAESETFRALRRRRERFWRRAIRASPRRRFLSRSLPRQSGLIWAGTTNGLIQLTQDGGLTWRNVTPPDLNEHSNVVISKLRTSIQMSRLPQWEIAATKRTLHLSHTRCRKKSGRKSQRDCRPAGSPMRFAKTPCAKACYTPRSPMASTFHSTTATTGNRSS